MSRQHLTEWIDTHFDSARELAIPLDLYFLENTEIECNILKRVGLSISALEFYVKLKIIKSKLGIMKIFVRYAGLKDDRTDLSKWISGDALWIVTKHSMRDIEDAFSEFEPKSITFESDVHGIIIDKGERIIELWWD
jgi:hypothetical protein